VSNPIFPIAPSTGSTSDDPDNDVADTRVHAEVVNAEERIAFARLAATTALDVLAAHGRHADEMRAVLAKLEDADDAIRRIRANL
jgi:hypothetical protein